MSDESVTPGGHKVVKQLIKVDLSVRPKRPEDVIEGMVPEDLSILYGDGGVAKTLLAMAEAHCIVTGKPYLGHEVKQGKVLYIDTEMGSNQIAYRAYQVALGLGLSQPPAGLGVYTLEADNINNAYGEIAAAVLDFQPILVYIDSLGAALGDMDAIAATVINPFMTKLQRLKVPCRLVDHQATLQKGEFYTGKSPYGSSYKRHRIRSLWQVQRTDNRIWNGLDLMLHHHKVNFGPLLDPIGVRVMFDGDAAVISPTAIGANADLLHLFATGKKRLRPVLLEYPGSTVAEVADRIGVKKETAQGYLNEEEKDGRVCHEAGAHHNVPWRYFLTDAGEGTDTPTETSGEVPGQVSALKRALTPLTPPTPSRPTDTTDTRLTPEPTPARTGEKNIIEWGEAAGRQQKECSGDHASDGKTHAFAATKEKEAS